MKHKTSSKASGETARMRRLAWSFAVCICPKVHFLMTQLKYAPIYAQKFIHMFDLASFVYSVTFKKGDF